MSDPLWVIGAPTQIFRARRAARRCGVGCGINILVAATLLGVLASVAAGHLDASYALIEAAFYVASPAVYAFSLGICLLAYFIELTSGLVTVAAYRVILPLLPFRGPRRVHEFFDSSLASLYGLVVGTAGWTGLALTLVHDALLKAPPLAYDTREPSLTLEQGLGAQAATLGLLLLCMWLHFERLDRRCIVPARTTTPRTDSSEGNDAASEVDGLVRLTMDPSYESSDDNDRDTPVPMRQHDGQISAGEGGPRRRRKADGEGGSDTTLQPAASTTSETTAKHLVGSLFLGQAGMRRFLLHVSLALALGLAASCLHLWAFQLRGGHASEMVALAGEHRYGVIGSAVAATRALASAAVMGFRAVYRLALQRADGG